MNIWLKNIVLLIGWFIPLFGMGQEVHFSGNYTIELVGDQMTYFEDVDGKASVHTVLDKIGRFEQKQNQVFTSPAIEGAIWVYFSFENRTGKDICMDVHNSNFNRLSLYKLDNQMNVLDSIHGGALLRKGLSLKKPTTFLFPIADKGDNEKYHFLLRTKTKIAIEIPIYFGTKSALYGNGFREHFMALFFIGSVLILFFYNMFFFFSLKKKIYLLYSILVFSLMLVGPHFNNFPVLEFFFNATIVHTYLNVWVWLPIAAGALFSIEYLKLKENAPKFRIGLIIIVSIFIFYIPFAFLSPGVLFIKIYVVLTLFFYLFCLVMGYYLLWKKRSKKVLLYCIGWTALVVSIVFTALIRNGFIEYALITRNISYVGFFIESLAFAIGIGQYMSELRLDQEKLNHALADSNEELRKANDSLDSFNYHVSHDLKTVLNNATALTSMIQKYTDREDLEKLKELSVKLKQVTVNGVETVQSFLSLGRIDSLFSAGIKAEIDLKDELHNTLQYHHLEGKIEVSVIQNELKPVKMHKKAVESIFLNLLTNTIKYSDGEPKAEIRFIRRKSKKIIIYKDFGKGIDLNRYGGSLFKAFERGADISGVEGTGIGLYILNRIVTNYGGTIDVESELGKGVTFSLIFPAT